MNTSYKKALNIKDIIYKLAPVISISTLLIVWTLVSANNPKIIPSPQAAFERFILLFERPIMKMTIFGHTWASLQRVLIALCISSILGILFGLFLGWSKNFKALFGPVFEMLRPIPPIAWIPLITLWFGIGETPKIIVVFIASFVPVVINTFTGVRMVDQLVIDVGKAFGANGKQLLRKIVIPSSLPAIFAGIRTGLSGGWMSVLAAEMIASKSGLGFLITRGMDSDDTPLILVSMIFIGIVGALISSGLVYVERWLCPWRTYQQ